MDYQQIEGTWEEVLTHAPTLEGHRVRVTVLSDDESNQASTYYHLIGAINSQSEPLHDSLPTPFSDAVVDKLSKQGIRLL